MTVHLSGMIPLKLGESVMMKGLLRNSKKQSVKTPEMLKLKAPINELLDDDVVVGHDAQGSDVVGLSELYNEAEITSPVVGGSSDVAACLAPQKRKSGARVGCGALAKKYGSAKLIKIEKE